MWFLTRRPRRRRRVENRRARRRGLRAANINTGGENERRRNVRIDVEKTLLRTVSANRRKKFRVGDFFTDVAVVPFLTATTLAGRRVRLFANLRRRQAFAVEVFEYQVHFESAGRDEFDRAVGAAFANPINANALRFGVDQNDLPSVFVRQRRVESVQRRHFQRTRKLRRSVRSERYSRGGVGDQRVAGRRIRGLLRADARPKIVRANAEREAEKN